MAEYIEKDKIVAWIWKQKRLAKSYMVMTIEETPPQMSHLWCMGGG